MVFFGFTGIPALRELPKRAGKLGIIVCEGFNTLPEQPYPNPAKPDSLSLCDGVG
jgi:hypothetical protein